MGLVNEAAEFYMEALQRKPTNVDARVKLKEVGQKYTSYMASEFFRNYNSGLYDASIESYERMKSFTKKAQDLSVNLTYPSGYDDDYKRAVDRYCQRNYDLGMSLVKQKKYNESLIYLNNVSKYNPEFKKTRELKTTAICEPNYQSAISSIEGKNYAQALKYLMSIQNQYGNYKDSRELLELCKEQQGKSLLVFNPGQGSDKKISELLLNQFSQSISINMQHITLINNSPFSTLPGGDAGSNVDLIQAIRKASGADYFYQFDVVNRKYTAPSPKVTNATCFRKVTVKKNDTLYVNEFWPIKYNQVKNTSSYSYEFKYKLINAQTNQIVNFQNITLAKEDQVEYNEFTQKPGGTMSDYFPYNPLTTPPINQYNPSSWRALFTANKTLKTEPELEDMLIKENVKQFEKTLNTYLK